MRILHVNKYLYRRGGAEAYMLDLASLQADAGDDVTLFGMSHPDNPELPYEAHFPSYVDIGNLAGPVMKARGLSRMFYSAGSRRDLRAVLVKFRPDVVHLHNIYHQLSPSILGAIAELGIPAVMTLHDYKLICPNYQLLDHGELCEACLDGRFRHAVERRCKDGSLLSSVAVALESRLHRSTHAYGAISRFICPSQFLADKITRAGVFPDRLVVLPHFIDTHSISVKGTEGGPFVYAGRLSQEKAVDVLVGAVALLPNCRLEVAGDGPQRQQLELLAERLAPGRIRFHGRLEKKSLYDLLRHSMVSVLPSRWYENQPMVVLESFAAGVAVVATHLGGLPEMVEDGVDGYLVAHDDPAGLAQTLAGMAEAPKRVLEMGRAGRRKVDAMFSPHRHLELLGEVYRTAIDGPAA